MPNFKGTVAVEHLICQDSNAPNVNFLIVVLMFDYLWRGVERSAALGVPESGSIDGPSEITDFYGIFMEENVFSLYVSMDNISFVHVFNSRADLLHVLFYLFLSNRLNT